MRLIFIQFLQSFITFHCNAQHSLSLTVKISANEKHLFNWIKKFYCKVDISCSICSLNVVADSPREFEYSTKKVSYVLFDNTHHLKHSLSQFYRCCEVLQLLPNAGVPTKLVKTTMRRTIQIDQNEQQMP